MSNKVWGVYAYTTDSRVLLELFWDHDDAQLWQKKRKAGATRLGCLLVLRELSIN